MHPQAWSRDWNGHCFAARVSRSDSAADGRGAVAIIGAGVGIVTAGREGATRVGSAVPVARATTRARHWSLTRASGLASEQSHAIRGVRRRPATIWAASRQFMP